MKVCALKTFASPVLSCREGDEFVVSDEQARDWIAAGLVRPVAPEVREAIAPPAEAAVTRKRKR